VSLDPTPKPKTSVWRNSIILFLHRQWLSILTIMHLFFGVKLSIFDRSSRKPFPHSRLFSKNNIEFWYCVNVLSQHATRFRFYFYPNRGLVFCLDEIVLVVYSWKHHKYTKWSVVRTLVYYKNIIESHGSLSTFRCV